MPTPPPTAPFDATVDGVRALIPEAAIPDTLPAGTTRGVTSAAVQGWLEDLSRRVELRLEGWERLTDAAEIALTGYARDLIHQGAASYTESARHPERAEGGYAAVLWRRFSEGLDELSAWLTVQLADPDSGNLPGAEPTGYGAYCFPPPSFTPERLRF